MPTTSPTQLSYDVFVSEGPAGVGGERMPDGAPLAWSPLSSTLIFGAQDAILVDPPFTRMQIQSIGDCRAAWAAQPTSTPLTGMATTCRHRGTGQALPGVTVTPPRARSRSCASRYPKPRAAVRQDLPGQIPETPVLAGRFRPGIPAGGQSGRGRRIPEGGHGGLREWLRALDQVVAFTRAPTSQATRTRTGRTLRPSWTKPGSTSRT
jgi:hypothetical protein